MAAPARLSHVRLLRPRASVPPEPAGAAPVRPPGAIRVPRRRSPRPRAGSGRSAHGAPPGDAGVARQQARPLPRHPAHHRRRAPRPAVSRPAGGRAGMTERARVQRWPDGPDPARDVVTVLDVPITNLTQKAAVALIRRWVAARDECSRSVFIANAHTLNLASEHPWYRDILRRADVVFGDGTGVRLAARLRGVRMCANLVGTDLVPRLMAESLSDGVRYYLLGAGADTVGRAVRSLEERIPGIAIAGFHHGFVDGEASREVVERINAARPGVLLVAMGNPLQEEWITRHLPDLRVPVSIGVGGLFDHWAGNL